MVSKGVFMKKRRRFGFKRRRKGKRFMSLSLKKGKRKKHYRIARGGIML